MLTNKGSQLTQNCAFKGLGYEQYCNLCFTHAVDAISERDYINLRKKCEG